MASFFILIFFFRTKNEAMKRAVTLSGAFISVLDFVLWMIYAFPNMDEKFWYR